jgi:hypothetical protein
MFHYVWELAEIRLSGERPVSEIKTRSSIYRANFDHDGTYRLRVVAADRYGNRSEPKIVDYNVALPKPKTTWEKLVSAWPVLLAALTGLYGLAFGMLLYLTRWHAWAFRVLSDAAWAKLLTWPFFFLRNVPAVQRWVLEPWFQEVRRGMLMDVPFLDPPISTNEGQSCAGTAILQRLHNKPRLWLHGRSGMGKSSLFAAWERAYYAEKNTPSLSATVKRYGFILVTLSVRHYATLPPPDINRPESWILETVRRRLEQFGFATHNLKLIDAMLRTGHIALGLDGTNEADQDMALAAFAKQFKQTRLLVTSQAMPAGDQWERRDEQWEVWRLPNDVRELRDRLLKLWLGDKNGAILSNRVVAENLSDTIVSGYDLRLLADLAGSDPEHAPLPADRIALYRAILDRAIGPDGQPVRLDELKQLAWTMVTQRRRKIVADDHEVLGDGTLRALEKDGVRIIRPIGAEHEFRHDQMRAFLAALWLVEEPPTLPALQKAATDAGAFSLNRRDQEELWRFVAPLLASDANLSGLWNFANDDPVERAYLIEALQAEADKRNVTLVRAAQRHEVAIA